MGAIGLLVKDFTLSFLWVWSGILVKIFVYHILGFHHDDVGEIVYLGLYLVNLFLFSFLSKIAKGGAYNPLSILSGAISGGFDKFLFTVGARIPVQVLGSIYGVRLLIHTFPEIGQGPKLNVSIHDGALTEGILSFLIVFLHSSLSRSLPGSFLRKTWIYGVSKLALKVLTSDLTGGSINPATVMGWAYARGDYLTKEHILVYWLAPIEGALLAVWISRLLFEKPKGKAKSE